MKIDPGCYIHGSHVTNGAEKDIMWVKNGKY